MDIKTFDVYVLNYHYFIALSKEVIEKKLMTLEERSQGYPSTLVSMQENLLNTAFNFHQMKDLSMQSIC